MEVTMRNPKTEMIPFLPSVGGMDGCGSIRVGSCCFSS